MSKSAQTSRAGKPRKSGVRALGQLVPGLIAPAAKKYGFSSADLIGHWPAIVGEDMAAICTPERISWPRRAPDAEDGSAPATATAGPAGAAAARPAGQPRNRDHRRPGQRLFRIRGHRQGDGAARRGGKRKPATRQRRLPSQLPPTRARTRHRGARRGSARGAGRTRRACSQEGRMRPGGADANVCARADAACRTAAAIVAISLVESGQAGRTAPTDNEAERQRKRY